MKDRTHQHILWQSWLDKNGKVELPLRLLEYTRWGEDDHLILSVHENSVALVVLRPEPVCIHCGRTAELTKVFYEKGTYTGTNMCINCLEETWDNHQAYRVEEPFQQDSPQDEPDRK